MSEEVEDKPEEEVNAVDAIEFQQKTLSEWQIELTVKMPAMPATSFEMQKVVADLNNKYQIAYNCYNELMVMHREQEINMNRQKFRAVKILMDEYKAKGVRTPAKETIESLVIEKDEDLASLMEDTIMYSIIKDFFENHKNKLSATMKVASDLLYSCGQSDRMFNKSERTNGL